MTTSVQAIGAGPFEFPISGTFAIKREGGATVFTTTDGTRSFTVGYFRNITGHGATEKAEQVSKRSAQAANTARACGCNNK